ncbi:MAG: hypothetical protein KDI36_07845 [Pseudomonadales bacterium]|nr:hypothetical protein [Pseudomonadales bacterium]
MTDDNDKPDNPPLNSKDLFPGAIPVLKDVVGAGDKQAQASAETLHRPDPPRYVDLFADIELPAIPNEDPDSSARTRAAAVVDQLVSEYSDDIIRRLREELTAVLEDLDPKLTDSGPAAPSADPSDDGTKQG